MLELSDSESGRSEPWRTGARRRRAARLRYGARAGDLAGAALHQAFCHQMFPIADTVPIIEIQHRNLVEVMDNGTGLIRFTGSGPRPIVANDQHLQGQLKADVI